MLRMVRRTNDSSLHCLNDMNDDEVILDGIKKQTKIIRIYQQ